MVSDQLLFVLKIALLILLYLFFFRVVRAVWAELRPTAARPQPVPVPAGAAAAPVAKRTRRAPAQPQLVVLEPAELFGRAYPLDTEASIGRAAGCQITLDDTYSSQIHARVFQRDGSWQIEDLGSTNGTWIERTRITTPTVLPVGAPLRVGRTTLQLQK